MASKIIYKNRLTPKHILELINVSGFSYEELSKKLGIKPSAFSLENFCSNWKVEEINKLLSTINNEDVQDYMMLELMRQAKDDEVLTVNDFKKEVSSWD